MSGPCMFCGADSRRNCEFHWMTDQEELEDVVPAPCEEYDDIELFGDDDD